MALDERSDGIRSTSRQRGAEEKRQADCQTRTLSSLTFHRTSKPRHKKRFFLTLRSPSCFPCLYHTPIHCPVSNECTLAIVSDRAI